MADVSVGRKTLLPSNHRFCMLPLPPSLLTFFFPFFSCTPFFDILLRLPFRIFLLSSLQTPDCIFFSRATETRELLCATWRDLSQEREELSKVIFLLKSRKRKRFSTTFSPKYSELIKISITIKVLHSLHSSFQLKHAIRISRYRYNAAANVWGGESVLCVGALEPFSYSILS